MKTLILVSVASLLAGCSSPLGILREIPDGKISYANLNIDGRLTTTSVLVENGTKENGILKVDTLKVDHTNPWVKKFEYEAKGTEIRIPTEPLKP